ncbi:MAG: hypothetical protein Q8P24_10685, partial [Desulfobacterales bacterium]|nr:hypothetical protein [Desulfobacterales bacterium]
MNRNNGRIPHSLPRGSSKSLPKLYNFFTRALIRRLILSSKRIPMLGFSNLIDGLVKSPKKTFY